MAKAKKKKVNKKVRIKRQILLIIIFILFSFIILYPRFFKSKIVPILINNNHQLSDIILFPGSKEQLYANKDGIVTLNYKTEPNVNYPDVLKYYADNLPKLGWHLFSSSETDVVFTNQQKRIRIWILYTNNNQNGVDYIIDYYSSEIKPTQISY